MGRFEDFYWGYKAFTKEAYRSYKREFVPTYGKYAWTHAINLSHYKVVVDREWVDVFTEYFPYIENCIQELRTFLKKEDDLVNIELANKINIGDTLSFLTQHTDVILEYDDVDNFVTPSKLINSFYENTYDIYENRFIYTLVNLCAEHIDAYFDIVDKQAGKTDVNVDSQQSQDNKWVSSKEVLQLGLTYFKKNRKDKTGVETEGIEDIWPLKDKVNEFMSTELIRALRGTKFITNPLTMTNVLQKNPNFKKAVELWDFINAYDTAPASVELIQERFFDEERSSAAFFEISNFNNFFLRLCVDDTFAEHLERDATRRQEEIERKARIKAEQELRQKIAEIKAAVEEQKAKDAEFYGNVIADLNARIGRYQEDTDEPIDALIQKYSLLFEQLEQSKRLLVDQLEKEHQKRFNDKYRMYLATIADQKHMRDREIAKLKDAHQKREEALTVKYNTAHDKEIENLINKHKLETEQILAEHKAEIDQLVDQYENKLATTIKNYEAQIEAQRSSYEQRIAELIAQHEKHLAEIIQNYQDEIVKLKATYEKRYAQTVLRYERRLEKLIAAHKQKVEAMQKRHERQIATLKERQKGDVDKLNEKHYAELMRLSDKCSAEIDRLKSKHKNNLEKMVKSYDAKLKNLAEKASKDREELKRQIERTKHNYQHTIDNMSIRHMKVVEKLNKKYAQLELSKKQAVAKVKKEMQLALQRKDKQYNLLQMRSQRALQRERQRSEARAQKDEQIRLQLVQNHSLDRLQLIEMYEARINDLLRASDERYIRVCAERDRLVQRGVDLLNAERLRNKNHEQKLEQRYLQLLAEQQRKAQEKYLGVCAQRDRLAQRFSELLQQERDKNLLRVERLGLRYRLSLEKQQRIANERYLGVCAQRDKVAQQMQEQLATERASNKFRVERLVANGNKRLDKQKLVTRRIVQKAQLQIELAEQQLAEQKRLHAQQLAIQQANASHQIATLQQQHQAQLDTVTTQYQSQTDKLQKQLDGERLISQQQLDKQRLQTEQQIEKLNKLTAVALAEEQKQHAKAEQKVIRERDAIILRSDKQLAKSKNQCEELKVIIKEQSALLAQQARQNQRLAQQQIQLQSQQIALAEQNKLLQSQLAEAQKIHQGLLSKQKVAKGRVERNAQALFAKADKKLAEVTQTIGQNNSLTASQIKKLSAKCQMAVDALFDDVIRLYDDGYQTQHQQLLQQLIVNKVATQLLLVIAQNEPIDEKVTKATFSQYPELVVVALQTLLDQGKIISTELGFCLNRN